MSDKQSKVKHGSSSLSSAPPSKAAGKGRKSSQSDGSGEASKTLVKPSAVPATNKKAPAKKQAFPALPVPTVAASASAAATPGGKLLIKPSLPLTAASFGSSLLSASGAKTSSGTVNLAAASTSAETNSKKPLPSIVYEPDPDDIYGLAEINGIRPKRLLANGEEVISADDKFTIKRTDDHYRCTCPGWRFQNATVTARTCVHLTLLLGSEYEKARLEEADPWKVATHDGLAEIDGITPRTFLYDGDEVFAVAKDSHDIYTIKRKGDYYTCDCPTWNFQRVRVALRTCKHLDHLLGEEYEEARMQASSLGLLGLQKPVARKRKTTAGEASVGSPSQPIKKSRAPLAPAKPALGVHSTLFQPLLAQVWNPETGVDPIGYLMSEKLDGVRAFWDGRAGEFRSREGHTLSAPSWFTAVLPRDAMLDGELWAGRGGFNDAVRIVRAGAAADEQWRACMAYHVFDVPSMGDRPFESRLEFARWMFAGVREVPWVHVIEHTVCIGRAHALSTLEALAGAGAEGIMLRAPASPYFNAPPHAMLKCKRFIEGEGVVVRYDLGQMVCEMLDGDSEGTGLVFAVRNPKMEALPQVGTVVLYRYQEYSKEGIPKMPIYVGEKYPAEDQ